MALCEGDFTGLVLSGTPCADQIEDAWNDITFEYAAAIKSENSDYTFKLAKDIGLLDWHIRYVQLAIEILRQKHVPELVESLIEEGYFNLQWTDDKKQWDQQLDRILSLLKSRIHDHEEMVAEYKRLQKTTSGVRQTTDDFNQTVLQMGRYQGYRIDQLTTMMDEYVSIFNNMVTESKAREKNGQTKN